eukprot:351553-Chlamydomonas_euryale.AAC.1
MIYKGEGTGQGMSQNTCMHSCVATDEMVHEPGLCRCGCGIDIRSGYPRISAHMGADSDMN